MTSTQRTGLLVLIGAGASYDCQKTGEPGPGDRMPLVSGLFDHNGDLDNFDIVRSIAGVVKREMDSARPDALSVEKYLRSLVDHPAEPSRRAARMVPVYLQARLLHLSLAWEPFSQNYSQLAFPVIDAVPDTAFVTLNYDTLLDHHLAMRRPFTTMESYYSGAERWLLIKPHGSVNWGRKVNLEREDIDNVRTLRGVMERYGDRFETYGRRDFIEPIPERAPLHERHVGNGLYYPALALPLGPDDDDVTCPPEHMDAFGAWLAGREIDVLAIGYSGLDTEILTRIHRGGPTIRTLTVVNWREATHAAALALRGPLHYSDQVATFEGGFDAFAGDSLRTYLAGIVSRG